MDNSDKIFEVTELLEELVNSYKKDSGTNFIDDTNLPVTSVVKEILDLLLEILFPGYKGIKCITSENVSFIVGSLICKARSILRTQISRALRQKYQGNLQYSDSVCERESDNITNYLLSALVNIRRILKTDVEAAYNGDPAAKSKEEIVISYPGLKAIAIHRIAHELYKKEVPLIPRMMNEIAHSETGIDIHPGASIGEQFFIDHGTGVVIGETSVIGKNVKIYQGVTLGALSFTIDENGKAVKGIKRHPNIEDNVTIYAEATILGNVTIGRNSIIGGNVWIKEDVKEGTLVGHSYQKNIEKKLL